MNGRFRDWENLVEFTRISLRFSSSFSVHWISGAHFHVTQIHSRLADRFNAQTFYQCIFLFSVFRPTTTRFWRFKKGLRIIWSYKKCIKTRRFESNISKIKLVSSVEYENVKNKYISYGSLSLNIHETKRKHVFGVDLFLFLFFTIAQSNRNVILSLN